MIEAAATLPHAEPSDIDRAGAARPGWTIFVLALCHAQAIASFQILNILIDPIKASLTISDTQYSLLQGLAVAIFAALLGIPAARWADRRSRRNVILAGAIGWSVATIACGFVASFGQLFAARVLMGIGEVFLFPAALSLIADVVPERRMSTAVALFGCGGPAGGAAALFGGGWIVSHHDALGALSPILAAIDPWRAAFVLCGLTGLITAALLLTVREANRTARAQAESDLKSVLTYVSARWSTFGAVSGGMLCLAICAFATSAWVPTLLVRSHGLSFDTVGRLTGTAALIGGTLLAWSAGRSTDWLHGRGWPTGVIIASLAVAGTLGMLVIVAGSISSSVVAIAAWLVIYALLAAPTVLAGTALQLITPSHMRAQIMAVHLLLVNMIALGIGPSVVAVLSDRMFSGATAIDHALVLVDASAAIVAVGLFAGFRHRYGKLRSDLR